jgi:hypothetical protein
LFQRWLWTPKFTVELYPMWTAWHKCVFVPFLDVWMVCF